MEKIEIFIQGEGLRDIEIVELPADARVDDLVGAARGLGLPAEGEVIVLLEDSDEALRGDSTLKEMGVKHRGHVHCHRCRKIDVTVNFNDEHHSREFPPSTTMARVKEWADKKFHLQGADATEHALQVCGTNNRPDEDVHIGTLVSAGHCALCLDLVPKVRVEG